MTLELQDHVCKCMYQGGKAWLGEHGNCARAFSELTDTEKLTPTKGPGPRELLFRLVGLSPLAYGEGCSSSHEPELRRHVSVSASMADVKTSPSDGSVLSLPTLLVCCSSNTMSISAQLWTRGGGLGVQGGGGGGRGFDSSLYASSHCFTRSS